MRKSAEFASQSRGRCTVVMHGYIVRTHKSYYQPAGYKRQHSIVHHQQITLEEFNKVSHLIPTRWFGIVVVATNAFNHRTAGLRHRFHIPLKFVCVSRWNGMRIKGCDGWVPTWKGHDCNDSVPFLINSIFIIRLRQRNSSIVWAPSDHL